MSSLSLILLVTSEMIFFKMLDLSFFGELERLQGFLRHEEFFFCICDLRNFHGFLQIAHVFT